MGSAGNQATRHHGVVTCWVGNTNGFIRWVCSAGIRRTVFFHVSQMPHYIRIRSRVSFSSTLTTAAARRPSGLCRSMTKARRRGKWDWGGIFSTAFVARKPPRRRAHVKRSESFEKFRSSKITLR